MLIVDDDETPREIIADTLRDAGYTLVTARDDLEALNAPPGTARSSLRRGLRLGDRSPLLHRLAQWREDVVHAGRALHDLVDPPDLVIR